MRDLANELQSLTGFTITTSAISDLEGGKRQPQWNTLAKLAAVEYILNPHTNQPYSVPELFMIACEALDPETGQVRELSACNSQ